MTKDELIEFLHENLSIEIERDHGYYSYPSLTVTLKLGNQVLSTSTETIYDGDRND